MPPCRKESVSEVLFAELFGFAVGDRVKIRWQRRYGHGKYWRYGKVTKVREHMFTKEPYYLVKIDGDSYPMTYETKEIVRCRQYVRKKNDI